jgi:hypothetical protein
LGIESSEFALNLLSQSTFKDGIVSALPFGIVVAHKFGEQGDANSKQLHDMAIIYTGDHPYLITIMTKGKEMKELSRIIGSISTLIYRRFDQKGLSLAIY